MRPEFVIDAGHGGRNRGAEYDGICERDYTLGVADAVYLALRDIEGGTFGPLVPGVSYTRLTRYGKTGYKRNSSRVKMADELGVPLISIHFNALVDENGVPSAAKGGRVFFPSLEHDLAPTAQRINDYLNRIVPTGSRLRPMRKPGGELAVHESTFKRAFMVNDPKAGGINVEACFLTSEDDREWLRDTRSVFAIGRAIAAGIVEARSRQSLPLAAFVDHAVVP